MLPVTSIFAAILALFFVVLSLAVIRQRRKLRQGFGDGGDKALLRVMRAHGNFAEYTPFALILLGLVEMTGAKTATVCLLGAALVIGRLMHAHGLLFMETKTPPRYRCRMIGMVTTFTMITISAVLLLICA